MVGLPLKRDIEKRDYLDHFESPFRPRYSTEAALITFVDVISGRIRRVQFSWLVISW